MSHATSLDALLIDLYTGIGEENGLDPFLRRLCAATNSHIGTLQHQSMANSGGNVSSIVGVDLSEVAHYAHYATQNVWFERMGHLITPGSTHFGDDWVTLAELKHTEFYDGLLRQVDVEHTLGIYIGNEDGISTFISPCRSEKIGPYTTDERRLVQQIAPHVVNAFTLLARLEALRQQADIAARTRQGVFWLDAGLHWTGGNAAAEYMVCAGWWKARHGAPLEACHATTRSFWRNAQQALSSGRLSTPDVFPVCAADGKVVAFARLHAYGASLAMHRGLPHYALFVNSIHGHDPAELASQLGSLFGLTPAEAALVAALRTCGGLELAALRLGISKPTARTRLQLVFDKTDVHSQAELIRMADALAEACG